MINIDTQSQPKITYTDKNETGCCPIPNIEEWRDKEFHWDNKKFVKDHTWSFMYMPLNMGQVMNRMWSKITKAEAAPADNEWMMLTHDTSMWRAEQYGSVTKDVPDAENVELSGDFVSRVYEGPYKEAGNWAKDIEAWVEEKGKKAKKLYFFYTTCPKCAKHYGKNYTIVIAQV